jgi:hypothetical protein
VLQQPQSYKKRNRHGDEASNKKSRKSPAAKIAFHRMLEEELAENVKNQRNENE